MSRPPVNPEKTTAGIAVDPKTLERVVPESKRSDGSVRKQLKIRPGFTPQEDVRRFRGTRQAQMDVNVLPKGHIIGWTPPSQSTAAASGSTKPLSKSAKKNAKRKEKRQEGKKEEEEVPENWDDDDDDVADNVKSTEDPKAFGSTNPPSVPSPHVSNPPSSNVVASNVEELTSQVEKLGFK